MKHENLYALTQIAVNAEIADKIKDDLLQFESSINRMENLNQTDLVFAKQLCHFASTNEEAAAIAQVVKGCFSSYALLFEVMQRIVYKLQQSESFQRGFAKSLDEFDKD